MRGTSVTPVRSDARHQVHKCCGAKAGPIACSLGVREFPSPGQCCLQVTGPQPGCGGAGCVPRQRSVPCWCTHPSEQRCFCSEPLNKMKGQSLTPTYPIPSFLVSWHYWEKIKSNCLFGTGYLCLSSSLPHDPAPLARV